jgi:hypothetical protein
MSLAQLARLLPLPESDLQQVFEYAGTLSKQETVDHFKNLLGESPQAIEFIASFNSRRKDPASKPLSEQTTQSDSGVPRVVRAPKKKKAPLHTLAPRQVQDNHAAQGKAYIKKDEDDYMSKRHNPSASPGPAHATVLQPPKAEVVPATISRAPPSAAGPLISDLKPKSAPTSRGTSRKSSPAPSKTRVNITGGMSMQGASTELKELDAAIRSLEISTNSSLLDNEKRKCNCIGARHPLLTAAPNCLNCGKVICVKEGLGPCTFCGTPLLSATEIQGMIRELREERGREKMALDASSHRRAEVSKTPAPFTTPRGGDASFMSPAEAKAKEHRDKLLSFQAQNVRRTTVRDEAADFETPITAGVNMWASPAERAKQLKRQQKVLAEQEWNARPEYEKRRQVVSIDLVKGKIVKRMGAVEKPSQPQSESEEVEEPPISDTSGNKSGGAFSRNPLLGSLVKPVYDNGNGKEIDDKLVERKKTWRRVQDDMDDNEDVILDGGIYGGVPV